MKKLVFLAAAALLSSSMALAEEKVLWETGMEGVDGTTGTVPEQYATGLIVSPMAFDGINAGAQLNININSSEWAQIYLKNYNKDQIYPTIDLNAGENVTVVLTNFQLDQISEGGFRIDASATLTITKVWVNTDVYIGDFDNALWIGNTTLNADWGGTPAKICPFEANIIEAGDTLQAYYTKTADDAYMMINYLSGEIEAQPDWQYFEGGQYFEVTEDFVTALRANGSGFAIKGYSINITQVALVKAGGSDSVKALTEESETSDIYSVTGILLHKNVNVADILPSLPSGLYIAGGKKILVR